MKQSSPTKTSKAENQFGSPTPAPLKGTRGINQNAYDGSPTKIDKANVLGTPIEIIQNKLFWISNTKPPQNYKNAFFFNIDDDLTYMPFNKDFGPLNLAMVHRYSRELARLLRDKNYEENRVFHYCTSEKPDKMVNGAFLMGCFMITILKCTAEQAYAMFRPYHHLFKSYRDASKGDCYYKCTLLQVLQGLEYAIKFDWYKFRTFNVKEYEQYERVENGDLNWIIPGKFMAFMGPIEKRDANQRYGHHPNKYVETFQKFSSKDNNNKDCLVKRVVRLNEEKYNKKYFVENGIAHNDLFFIDGSTPPDNIVERWMELCDSHFATPDCGAIAVHCKAGLGRTGTLIGLWAMKHYQIPAEAFIGWIRIARPGSILGPQQFYLPKMEPNYINSSHSAQKSKLMAQQLESSPIDRHKAQYGETGQANYLILAKEQSADKRPNKQLFGRDEIKEEIPSSPQKQIKK